MTFSQSLEYLYSLRRFGIKLGLENTRNLLDRLGRPQDHLRCLHVAGTNGKGSVSHFLAEILSRHGRRVGLYTSPHLHCFTERVRVDGQPISRDLAATLLTEIKSAAAGLPITFFEATTVLALLAFARQGVEFAVLETGMGGRLDATNVVDPEVCCITPVSLDHQEHLGATLEAIAREKAGIIKPSVPVVVGMQSAGVLAVLEQHAGRLDAPVRLAGRDFNWQGDHETFRFDGCGMSFDGLVCSQAGRYQLDNFSQAIAAALTLKATGLQWSAAVLADVGRTAHWPGRLEWWPSHRVLLDAAHNRAGAETLAAYLTERRWGRVNVLAGLSGAREPADVLVPLSDHIDRLFAVPVPEETTVPPARIQAWAEAVGLACQTFAEHGIGLEAALTERRPDQPLVVCGSIFLVAAVRAWLVSQEPDLLTAELTA